MAQREEGCTMSEARGQLLQIYNMDSGNAMELDPHVDPNESVFPQRSIFAR